MALLHTPEKIKGFKSPHFSLLGVCGQNHSLKNCMDKNGLLVMFICNHCPYVIAILDRLVTTCEQLQKGNIGCVAIMSNDTDSYEEDSFDNMKIFFNQNNFTFPYLIDKTQETAKAYGAVCTPDFFGFNSSGILQYRGRLDSANNKPADKNTIPELLNAMLEIKESGITTAKQSPSMGCSIKWK